MPKDKILEMSADEAIRRFSSGIAVPAYHTCKECPEENVFLGISNYNFMPEIRKILEDKGFAKKDGYVIEFGVFNGSDKLGYYNIFINHVCAVEEVSLNTCSFEFHYLDLYFEYLGEIYVVYDDLLMMNAWKA